MRVERKSTPSHQGPSHPRAPARRDRRGPRRLLLTRQERAGSPVPRRGPRGERCDVKDVADELGNTPAVCRSSSIDPRLIDLWERGQTITPRRNRAAAERAVRDLLS